MVVCLLVMVLIIGTGGFELFGITFHHLRNPLRVLGVLVLLRILLRAKTIASWISSNKRSIGLAFLLFLLAAVPRMLDLSANSMNVDEPKWIARGKISYTRFCRGDWVRATEVTRHPGLIPALLIGISYLKLGLNTHPSSLDLMYAETAALGSLLPVERSEG